jgi:hypothetical protein
MLKKNFNEVAEIIVATVPPTISGVRSPALAKKPPMREPKGISPHTIVRRAPCIRPKSSCGIKFWYIDINKMFQFDIVNDPNVAKSMKIEMLEAKP